MYYTGEQIKPLVNVKYAAANLVEGTDYTLTYGANTAVGQGSVKVTGIGNFSGEKTIVFGIVEQKIDIDTYWAQFNPTYYILPNLTAKTGFTACARPTYDGKIYVVKLVPSAQMKLGDLIALLSETQQESVKVFYANGTLMQKSYYNSTILITGMRVMLTDNNVITDDLYIALSGDINGDGVASAADLNMLKKHLRGTPGIAGVGAIAADINGDCVINVADVSQFTTWG